MRNEKSPKENSKSNKSPICHACGKPIRFVTIFEFRFGVEVKFENFLSFWVF